MKIAKPRLFLTLLSLAVATSVFADCTTQAPGNLTVNGATLWPEVPTASSRHFATDCDVDQFAWNNFLYLTGNDASGHPRFMSLAPWFKAMPAKPDKPSWSGKYTPLDGTQMLEQLNKTQAGDGFHLLDVNGKTVTYDIRINEDYLNYIAKNKLYTKQAIKKAEGAFKANPSKGGIWLPPTTLTDKKSALEIKTSWRNYGNTAGVCPETIMHCEQDSTGIWWGLIGMHLVQKTPYHGELIWASFEHVANSPDCAPGGSNPIKQNPGNLNANLNIPALKDKTGWNLFNFAAYQGKNGTCAYPWAIARSMLSA